MKEVFVKYRLVLPLSLWLLIFLVLPYVFILTQSFLASDNFGQVIYDFNIDSYSKFFTNSLYYTTLLRTLFIAVVVATTCVFLSIPLAYFIAFRVKKYKTILYALIVLPFWMSYIVRAYAWKIILGQNGILNSFMMYVGITEEPLEFLLYSNFSVVICLVHIFTPFVAIPIYTAFEQIPKALVEASKDLGAGSWTTLWKVILPLGLPGIISGGTFALVLTMGDFLTPVLLGGPDTLFISNIVQNLFGTSNDKPMGSAVGILMLILILILLEYSGHMERKYASFKSKSY
ncbi:MAG: ABC transporter permease [Cyclobacteriaceae bacterium]|nr:ABC transporter permease [Cyclobacteriaceae bacterium HetDA_MAG_MS6]